mmetsp:Transcript_2840/g.7363  ORF Transcript_2840/g.7363 Transcript_2840/m.7363 type:complete len:80 (-) Transcript_2840:13-252(-)
MNTRTDSQPHCQGHRKLLVYGVKILRKQVDEAAKRCRIKESHGCLEQPVEQIVMQFVSRSLPDVRHQSERNAREHDGRD